MRKTSRYGSRAEDLAIETELDSRDKFRGIFHSPVFTGEIGLTGHFDLTELLPETDKNEQLFPEEAELLIPFFNQKVISGIAEAKWMGRNLELEPGTSGLSIGSGGIHSEVDAAAADEDGGLAGFRIRIRVRGAGEISVLPLASSAVIRMNSDWPSPSFKGAYLPDSHKIGEQGFSAEWSCSSLSSGLPVRWTDQTVFDDYQLSSSYITADLISVNDLYAQNERAVKYAVLFILMPFIALFLFEHFFRQRLHAIQYILAGIANIVFYLLLLSLSEHISFNLSYLISAVSVTVLLSFYTFSVLKKEKRAFFIVPVMAASYLFLFVTLQSEDWALLIGSAGVFVITAFIMFITRKIDFYGDR